MTNEGKVKRPEKGWFFASLWLLCQLTGPPQLLNDLI